MIKQLFYSISLSAIISSSKIRNHIQDIKKVEESESKQKMESITSFTKSPLNYVFRVSNQKKFGLPSYVAKEVREYAKQNFRRDMSKPGINLKICTQIIYSLKWMFEKWAEIDLTEKVRVRVRAFVNMAIIFGSRKRWGIFTS